MPLHSIVLEVQARTIRQENEITGIQTGKEGEKLSLVTDDMVLYVKNPKEFIHTCTHTTIKANKFGKVAGYKINSRKSVVFLYTNNEQCKKTFKEQFHLQ